MISHALAHGLASLGRGKDSMLMHVTPNEVAGLKAVAKAMGGQVTTNPHTGLPEAGFFDFIGSLLPTIVGIALAPETGGSSIPALMGGAATGAAVAAIKGTNPLMGLITGGMGGWGGSSLGSEFGTMAKGATATAPEAGAAVNTAGNIGTTADTLANTAESLPGGGIGNLGPNMGQVNTAASQEVANLPPLQEAPTLASTVPDMSKINTVASEVGGGGQELPQTMLERAGSNMSNVGKGLWSMVEHPTTAWKSFTDAGGSATQIALPVGYAALNSIDPYIAPIDPLGKYDPNRRLSLAGQSRLVLDPNMTGAKGGLASIDGFKRYAIGGAVGGAVQPAQAYTPPDGNPAQNVAQQGFGIGRLDQLAQAQSMNEAKEQGYAHGGYLDGPGDGMSDSIHASIEGTQPAKLADGEFVVPADVVSHIGNGSSKAGAQRLYGMMDRIRKARTGTTRQGRQINPNKFMPA